MLACTSVLKLPNQEGVKTFIRDLRIAKQQIQVRKALFNFDIGRYFKHANLLGINPILPSKTGGVLQTIGSASKHLQRDAPGWCIYIRSRRACDKFASTYVFLAVWRRGAGNVTYVRYICLGKALPYLVYRLLLFP